MIRLHNTLTRQLDPLTPQYKGKLSLYTCGPTVYAEPHVGNWVAFIRWDILVRTLHANGYAVERVMNITDVGHLTSDEDEGEDKMQKGARRENVTAWDIAAKYTESFLDGMQQLNLITPEHITKATDYIPQQLALVRTLKQKGYTYQISDGIYFDTSKFPTYADFAQLDLDAMQAGARVEYNPEKRNPSDFALWKFSPENEQRDMEWDTPADLLENDTTHNGFPGWHLECSAMAMDILGTTLDIHTGGIDHIPVHHTNEIAQSEAASGQRFANYWLHANHIKVGGTKIAKSLGNGYTIANMAERGFSPLDFKMFVLQSHYRTESNFTWENIAAAHNRLTRWRSVTALRWQTTDRPLLEEEQGTNEFTVQLFSTKQNTLYALDDDLNTPHALELIDEVFTNADKHLIADHQQDTFVSLLETIDSLLGLKLLETTPDITVKQKELIAERTNARTNKDWVKADTIRDQLLADGIALRDTSYGVIWSYSPTSEMHRG